MLLQSNRESLHKKTKTQDLRHLQDSMCNWRPPSEEGQLDSISGSGIIAVAVAHIIGFAGSVVPPASSALLQAITVMDSQNKQPPCCSCCCCGCRCCYALALVNKGLPLNRCNLNPVANLVCVCSLPSLLAALPARVPVHCCCQAVPWLIPAAAVPRERGASVLAPDASHPVQIHCKDHPGHCNSKYTKLVVTWQSYRCCWLNSVRDEA